MKKKKGFTLIELLVVIILLALLMLIALPKILSIIEDARKQAFVESYELVTKGIKTQIQTTEISKSNMFEKIGICYDFDFGEKNSNYTKLDIKNKEKFIDGKIMSCNGRISYYELTDGRYVVNGDGIVSKYEKEEEDTSITQLVDGYDFNYKIKDLSNGNDIVNITNAQSIDDGYKKDDNIISTTSSKYPVYAWYDNNTIYMYSDAKKIYMNQDASDMFYEISGLKSIDFSKIDTSKTTNMSGMFSFLNDVEAIDLSSFNTSNVTDMRNMFYSSSFKTIDISNFDTSKTLIIESMFSQLYNDGENNLTTIVLPKNFGAAATDFTELFADCNKLTTLNEENINTLSATKLSSMFEGCASLETLDLTNMRTPNVTNMSNMFEYCLGLVSLDLSGFDTSNVTNMEGMFPKDYGDGNDIHLKTIVLPQNFASNITDFSEMFARIKTLESINAENVDVSNATNLSSMFYDCENLKSLNLSTYDTKNVTSISYMFYNCENLESITFSNKFKTDKVTSFLGIFSGCKKLTTVDISSFDNSNVDVNDTYDMFDYCESLTTIYVSDLWVAKDDMYVFFSDCYNLVGGAGTTYEYYMNNDNGKSYARVDEGEANPGLFTKKTN